MDEQKQEAPEEVALEVDTQHEPHEHARSRLWLGVGAVLLIIIGFFVWIVWGEEIKEACLGDGEVCTVELPDSPSEGGVDFNKTFIE